MVKVRSTVAQCESLSGVFLAHDYFTSAIIIIILRRICIREFAPARTKSKRVQSAFKLRRISDGTSATNFRRVACGGTDVKKKLHECTS